MFQVVVVGLGHEPALAALAVYFGVFLKLESSLFIETLQLFNTPFFFSSNLL